jgi:hypothetical protein
VIVGIFLRHAFADHERQKRIVKQSSLSWNIARPPHLKDGPRTGEYQHGFPATYPSMGASLRIVALSLGADLTCQNEA